MNRFKIIITFFSILFSCCVAGQDVIRFKEASEGVKITEITVTNTRYGDGIRRGTTALSITINREDADILSVATDRCELKSLIDNNGARLDEESKQDAMGTAIAWYALGVSRDGKSAGVKAQVTSLPSVGASSLKASGKIMLITGKTRATVKDAGLDISEGTKIKAGDTVVSIENVEKPEDNKTTSITLQYDDIPNRIIDIEFFDGKGAKIEKISEDYSVIAIKPDGKGSTKIIYNLNGDISKADVRVTFWEETAETSVTLDCMAGLGLTK